MNERLREALRRKIARHNKFVHLYTVWSGFLVMCMWVAVYFIAHWAIVFSRTLTQGVDAEGPTNFGWGFAVFLIFWFAAGWFEQMRRPPYLTSNDRTLGEIFMEFALFPPRATLSTIRHAVDRVQLDEAELALATDVLERIGRAGKVPIDSVDGMFDPEIDHARLTNALRKLELIHVRRIKGAEFWAITDPGKLNAFL